jgi:hypothetical protein
MFDAKTQLLLSLNSFASSVTIFGFGLNYAGFATGSKLLQDYAQYISIVRRMASSFRQKISPVDVSLKATVLQYEKICCRECRRELRTSCHPNFLLTFKFPHNRMARRDQKYLHPNIPFLRFPILTNCSIHPSCPVQTPCR